MKLSIPLRTVELELLKDPECAREYLKVSLEETRKDGNRDAFIRALRNVVDARRGMAGFKEPSGTLYQSIYEEENFRLETLETVLEDIGLCLSVGVVKKHCA